MTQSEYPITCLLLTGSELMSGDTIDTNSAFLAESLLQIGISIQQKLTLGDDLSLLVKSIGELTQICDLLIINGGLGPTQDDLTSEAIALATNQNIITHDDAKQHILKWCANKSITANNANLKQAELPANSTIFTLAPGSAPAFYLRHNNCLILATPGVPSELKIITQQNLLPFIQSVYKHPKLKQWKKIQLLGIGESRLQEILDTKIPSIKQNMDIGFRVNFPMLEFKYKPWKHIEEDSETFITQEMLLRQHIDDYIIIEGNQHLSNLLVSQLSEKRKTLSCAESCTGGLISSYITRYPGASAIFPGSVISYSNNIKQQCLNVSKDTIKQYGAVSENTALEMLSGILLTMKTDYGIAVTGIAGPDGGSIDKPVGTVFIAWGSLEHQKWVRLQLNFPRNQFQELVAIIALDLIRRLDKGEAKLPSYLIRWQHR